jgi:hypothetical protein
MDRFWVRRAAITCVVVLVAACGSAATPSPSASVAATPSPTASATASPSPVPATPSPTPTPTATPTLELKTLDSITSAPLPKTAVTAQNVTDAMSPVIDYYTQHPELVDARINLSMRTIATQLIPQCLDTSDHYTRLANCEGLAARVWLTYETTGNGDFYSAAMSIFNYVVGPNGIPNTPNVRDVRRDLTTYLVAAG